MRRRQRARLQAAEKARQERQEQEAREELERRTVYRVLFGEPTLEDFEQAHGLHYAEIIEGTATARTRTLKRNGILTADGARMYAELSEAAKK